MKPWVVLATVLVIVLSAALPSTVGAADDGRDRPRTDHSGPLTGLLGVRVDPSGSLVQVLRQPTRNPIDSQLMMISAVCTNCGSGCPPLSRTVEVVLEANAPVAAGYGVSNLTSSNWTVTNVAQSTSAALAVGQQVTVTITGDVLSCSSWFNVWFSMCGHAASPDRWDDPCPTVTLLHEFVGGASDGSYPYGSLTLSGSTLYGMTERGGDSNVGVVFSMATDGTSFTVLHEFAGGGSDGSHPLGDLTLGGSTLYGVTNQGGDFNRGVVFSMATDGTSFTLLHEFAGGGSDGQYPRGRLTLSGSTLYGVTNEGGDSNVGVVFSMATDGTSFTVLHEFAGGGSDGSYPLGDLTLGGSTLYGMTPNGGDLDLGVVFSIGTDGSGFTLLREFAGGGSDGRWSAGNLALSGSTLYGPTRGGGDSNLGVVFSMATDGSSFTLLHEFVGGGSDGRLPLQCLALSGSTLYGMTPYGGDSDLGVVFSMATDGTRFTLLHEFAGGGSDGARPWYGQPSLDGSTIFGMTSQGGDSNLGVVFKLE